MNDEHSRPDSAADGVGAPATSDPGAASVLEPQREDVAAVEWIFAEAEAGRVLPVVEADAIVNAMYAEQKWGGRPVFPLVRSTDSASWLPVHAVNVAGMAMALAGAQQFEPAAIRRVGLASLLCDVGMIGVADSIRRKRGPITTDEREQVMGHPADGAKLLLGASASLDLAATVAYEHHLKSDGSGYPRLVYPRSAHFVSRLVQVCDVFCALSSVRPYREAWPLDVILSYLDERSGFEFHPTIATALTGLVRESMTTHAAT